MDVERLSDTGALGALVRATEDAAVYRVSTRADGEQHRRAVEKREALVLELLRRLCGKRETV